MKSLFKSISTIAIWLAAAGIVIGTNVDGTTAGGVIIALATLASAMGGTGMLWSEGSNEDEASADTEKKKRTATSNPELETLLAMMTEDEREVFKQQLKDRLLKSTARLADEDGEISLGELLSDDAQQPRMSDSG